MNIEQFFEKEYGKYSIAEKNRPLFTAKDMMSFTRKALALKQGIDNTKTMKITFKSGNELPITQEIANVIKDNILQNITRYNLFSKQGGDVTNIINVEAIDFITNNKWA
jgi:hypothetical protein